MSPKPVSLQVSCPLCGKSLMTQEVLINNKERIFVDIILIDKTKGRLNLSSIYGDYSFTSDVAIPENEIVNMFCPHCKDSLHRDVKCTSCDAPIVSFNICIGGRVSFCSRKGCKNHYIVFEDLETGIRRFYDEYGYK